VICKSMIAWELWLQKVVMLLSILVLGRSDFLRDDFDLLEYEFPENKDIKIYPISDLHIGASEFMLEAWTKYAGYALRGQLLPGAYALQEIILRSNKKSVRVVME